MMDSYQDLEPPTSRLPRFHFKNIFTWRRPPLSRKPLPDQPRALRSTPSSPALIQQSSSNPRPPLTSRSRTYSGTTRRPRTQGRDRPRDTAFSDPPPLFQAYSQAIIHATLEVPSGSGQSSTTANHATNFISKKDFVPSGPESRTFPPRGHNRGMSISSTSESREKLFFLTNNGYLMQYSVDGGHDRLPEKILELNKGSLAFASDAVPGKHWVLQVASNGNNIGDAKVVPPQGWSKLHFRTAENKRAASKLLLIFDDPEELYSWLFALRKEIEQYGGLEYRPDTRRGSGDETEFTKQIPELKHLPLCTNIAPLSPTSSCFDVERTPLALEAPPIPRTPSAQSTNSSSGTCRSLERLRESTISDGCVSTAYTNASYDGSHASLSPKIDRPPSIIAISDLGGYDWPVLQSPPDPVTQRLMSNMVALSKRSKYKRKPSIQKLDLSTDCAEMKLSSTAPNKELPDLPRAAETSPNARPVSVLAPLPIPTNTRQPMTCSQRSRSIDNTDHGASVQNRGSVSNQGVQEKRSSFLDCQNDTSKAKYTLFPKRLSSNMDGKLENLPQVTIAQSSHITRPGAEAAMSTSNQNQFILRKASHRRSGSIPTSLPTLNRYSSSLLSPHPFDKPQRSPAVTEFHLLSNFGTSPMYRSSDLPSPTYSPSDILKLEDLKLNLSHFSAPASNKASEQKQSSPTSKMSRGLSPVKSMPNIASNTPAPSGPPPIGPLPALPSQMAETSFLRSASSGSRSSTASSTRPRSFKSVAHSRTSSHTAKVSKSRTRSRSPVYIPVISTTPMPPKSSSSAPPRKTSIKRTFSCTSKEVEITHKRDYSNRSIIVATVAAAKDYD